MDESFFDALWDWTTAAFAGLILNGVFLFKYWSSIMGRRNERLRDKAEERAGDWDRLREEVGRLSERVKLLEDQRDALERDVRDSHRERDDAIRERDHERAGRLEAEAMLMARQRNDQEVQRRLSEGREHDAEERRKDGE